MVDTAQIKEHAPVIGADGVPCRHRRPRSGRSHQLTKTDSGDGKHHYISLGLVAEVEGETVRLSANADVAITFEEAE